MRQLFIVILLCSSWTYAQDTDLVVQYGPEWELIKQSYTQITDEFQSTRHHLLDNKLLSSAEKKIHIQQAYDQYLQKSRELASRRAEIIKIAAEKHGLTVSLGTDATQGRGMNSDIDLAGSPTQTKKFMEELKQIGIADAFDDVHCVQKTPGYVSIRGPMDTTVNYTGAQGPVGTEAHYNQIHVDARSAETYLSVAMKKNQPGRRSVEALDHLRKARKGLKTPANLILDKPEALQGACKGTLKAMNTLDISDVELEGILKRNHLDMDPQDFRVTLESIRSGQNIAPELADLKRKDIHKFHSALDDTTRTCQKKAKVLFEIEMDQAQGLENTLRQSNDPAIRQNIVEVRSDKIDSTLRMQENLKALDEMDVDSLMLRKERAETNMEIARRGNDPLHKKNASVQLENVKADIERLKTAGEATDDWMKAIKRGQGPKPKGPSMLGKTQNTIPGAMLVDDLVTQGKQTYKNIVDSPRTAKIAGYGMQGFGAGMSGYSWYASSVAQGDSNAVAIGKGLFAGAMSLTNFGSAIIDGVDIYSTYTVKFEKFRNDQSMTLALKGVDLSDEKMAELIDRRVMVRKGIYGAIKGTNFASIFCANPMLMVAAAGLDASLSIYEAREESELWQEYAIQLERMNDQMTEANAHRGGAVAPLIAKHYQQQAEHLQQIRQLYDEMMKEEQSLAALKSDFISKNEGYQTYLQGLSQQAHQLQGAPTTDTLTVLNQVISQAKQGQTYAGNTASRLKSDPGQLASAQAILSQLCNEYRALSLQVDQHRSAVAGARIQWQLLQGTESPVQNLQAHQQQMAQLKTFLQPRRQAMISLMSMSSRVGKMITDLQATIKNSISRMTDYEKYLRLKCPNERVQLKQVQQSLITIKSITLPTWELGFQERITRHYANINLLVKTIDTTQTLIDSVYPEPIQSLHKAITPENLSTVKAIPVQWTQTSQAMKEFYQALGSLRVAVGSTDTLPEEEIAGDDEWDQDDIDDLYAGAEDQPAEILNAELERLQALRHELQKRADADIANLNKVFFKDRDALRKAYENAFKEPQMLACENCNAETLHSMDYSDSPPSVWCNSCGCILSFSSWSGAGQSLNKIRITGRAKKQQILDQLAANQRAIDQAIHQIRTARQ